MPLLNISYSVPLISFVLVFILVGLIQVVIMVIILVSYTSIKFTVIKRKSFKEIKKVFSTCGTHLYFITLFF
ncbi:rCG52533, partial [Rattus norvegicus]